MYNSIVFNLVNSPSPKDNEYLKFQLNSIGVGRTHGKLNDNIVKYNVENINEMSTILKNVTSIIETKDKDSPKKDIKPFKKSESINDSFSKEANKSNKFFLILKRIGFIETILNSLHFKNDLINFSRRILAEGQKESQYKDLIEIKTLFANLILVTNRKIILEVLKVNRAIEGKSFGANRLIKAAQSIIEAPFHEHQKLRRFTIDHFRSTETLYLKSMYDSSERLMEKWHLDLKQNGVINASTSMKETLIDILINQIFGFPNEGKIKDLPRAVKDLIHKRIVFGPSYNQKKLKQIKECILEQIAQIRSNDALLEKQNLTTKMIAKGDSDQEICNLMALFLFAGQDTTVNLLLFIIQELGLNHDWQEAIYNDWINSEKKTSTEFINSTNLDAYPTLKYVIEEGLRFYPPLYHQTRQVMEDINIQGYDFKKGSWVFLMHYFSQRDERNCSNPDQFNPGRYLNTNSEKELDKLNRTLSFGGGSPNNCIGSVLARRQLECLLINMIIHFKWTSFHTKNEATAKITLEPSKDVLITLSPRKNLTPMD